MPAVLEINIVDNSPGGGGGGGGTGGGGGQGSRGGRSPDEIEYERQQRVAARHYATIRKYEEQSQREYLADLKDRHRQVILAGREEKKEEGRQEKERLADLKDRHRARIMAGRAEKKAEEAEDKRRANEFAQNEKRYQNNVAAIAKKAADDEKEIKKAKMSFAVGAAGAAAALIRGGGVGAAVGGGLGAAVGGKRGGPAGAVIGGALGEKLGGGLDGIGSLPGRIASNDGVGIATGAIEGAANAAAAGLSLLGPAGVVAGVGVSALGKASTAAVDAMNAFAARGKELAGYNGQIAGAAANQDVARLLMDIREGQKLGDQYGKVIEAQTKFELTLQAGLLPIKEFIMDRLPPYLDEILVALIAMVRGLAHLTEDNSVLDKAVAEMEKIRKALEDGDMPGAKEMFDEWLRPMRAMPGDPAPGPAAARFPPGGGRGEMIPLFVP